MSAERPAVGHLKAVIREYGRSLHNLREHRVTLAAEMEKSKERDEQLCVLIDDLELALARMEEGTR